MDKIWLRHYPSGVPHEIDPSVYRSLVELMDEGFAAHRDKAAYKFMGQTWTFAQIDRLSQAFAAYLQGLGLPAGARVAVMMPNVPQYPVVVTAILRAGFVVVNVNPLYTPRELEHQLTDSGSQAIVIIENFAATLQAVIAQTPVKHVVLASMGDLLGLLKGSLVNHVVRRVRKLVPHFSLPGGVRFNAALAKGRGRAYQPARPGPDDIAVLQYTGGTTGVSKGAMLLHRNIIANLLQSEAWNAPMWKQVPDGEQPTTVCALPLYHIFGFTVSMMVGLRLGTCNILIPNPRDLAATLKELSRHRFHSFPAVNTLFGALARHPDFHKVDWSHLRLSVGGGMAVQQATAKLWKEKTGCAVFEGYGLSETSPSVTCNPVTSTGYSGSIGLPLPSTEVCVLDDAGREVPLGQPGELAVRGPQVMAGYWQRPDETAKVMTADGFFRTGDIATIDDRGYVKIVDRKKDMILVSGFNVYPNEVEDVVTQMPGILECAAVGMPDEHSGEAVKLVIVRQNPAVTEQQVRDYCAQHLTGYKRPKVVDFRGELPKTPVGKILRRELREPA
ncbi:long-chain-fatty-acid--CoA ligase [Aquabacterium sp. CECT 9606]|uniref:long-chain-fatty-acid--CoA ligase n=1 Tax=Aquabacterium sp. CECT 9606 TaxID=2845822 RepID=UPI001E4103B6|nr:long-chain-fatty-acid--CoA ligase [Aquabacterium sp. CECT 9606]CAH0350966.1 Long-chain-fatty-acid--CoA ligase [Aquabacterium sp. CECT 9606]